jgi:hypothetical protein
MLKWFRLKAKVYTRPVGNYLTTGYTPKRHYLKLLPAPKALKQALLGKIQREIELHSENTPGLIQFKMNALEGCRPGTELMLLKFFRAQGGSGDNLSRG